MLPPPLEGILIPPLEPDHQQSVECTVRQANNTAKPDVIPSPALFILVALLLMFSGSFAGWLDGWCVVAEDPNEHFCVGLGVYRGKVRAKSLFGLVEAVAIRSETHRLRFTRDVL
jgi:hypothetical protein